LRTLDGLAGQRYVSPVEFMTTAFAAAGDREAGYRWRQGVRRTLLRDADPEG
jgi:hypothetical protein